MASVVYPDLFKSVKLHDGTTYGYARVEAKAGKPTLFFLHGFPSSSFDWRHQVDPLAKQGFGLIVPDLLGYGDTDKPKELKNYTLGNMGRQIVELLQKENITKVIGIGHDWGSVLLSGLVRKNPEIFSSVIFLAVPYVVGGVENLDEMSVQIEKVLGYSPFGYWYFHKEEDASDLILAHPESYISIIYPEDPRSWIQTLCAKGATRKLLSSNTIGPRAPYISDEEALTHTNIFAKGGYDGPLNWYRQQMAGLTPAEDAHLNPEQLINHLPTLFVRAEKDAVSIPDMMEQMTRPVTKDLTIESLDTSHWLMLEKPDEVNRLIGEWALVDGH